MPAGLPHTFALENIYNINIEHMKVNFKTTGSQKVMSAVIAAVIGLTGCMTETVIDGMDNNACNNTVKSDAKNVTLKVANQSPTTRAEGVGMANNETVEFDNGYLLFASAQNNITKVMEITKNSTNPLTDTQVDISDLTNEVEIQNVPGHSTYVYAIGNLPAGFAAPTTGASLTALKQQLIDFYSQEDIKKVTLAGGDFIKEENQKSVARFPITPLVARIEIGKISSSKSSDIISFDIDGIFINNYYRQVSLDGQAPDAAIKNTDKNEFAANSNAYPDKYKGILSDCKDAQNQSLGTASAPNAYTPAGGNSWVYNLLAPISAAQTLTTPHIVIAISNIKTNNGIDYNGTWYLTVTNLVHNNKKLTHLIPGKIYSINHINFSHSNILTDPEMESMSVDVEVTLVKWEVLNTDVIFGQD